LAIKNGLFQLRAVEELELIASVLRVSSRLV
jgi:hypothetical protein